MDLARQAGLVVSLDLNLRLESWGMDRELRKIFEQAIELSDLVFGSGVEEIIPYSGETSVQAGAETLSAGNKTVIARLGGEGAFVVAPGESFTSPAFQVEMVDSLGAGDAFNGGFIAARLGGEELPEAARWGNAAAALKIRKTGARGLPTRQELMVLLAGRVGEDLTDI